MSGHTIDSNSATIAQALDDVGLTISRKITIGDEFDLLVSQMTHLSANSDVLIVNGGLGPTIDDLTAEALSKTTGHAIEENGEALSHLTLWCEKLKIPLNQANRKQAMLPKGVQIIPNPRGSAVGFYIDHSDCLIICTPGVPSELKAMLEQTIITLLQQRFPNYQPKSMIRLQTFGVGESTLQQLVINECQDWPQSVELGFRAGLPQLEVKLSISDSCYQDVQQHCHQRLRELIGDYIIGEQDTTLGKAVVTALQGSGQSITTAESCTGGQIAAAITQVPGASQVFEAGFVTYSNDMKQQLLGVNQDSLLEHGAVSEAIVQQMALGALERSQATYAVAVSGIAGPDGGSTEKPVGTVCIAWGSKTSLKTTTLRFNRSRQWFQTMVSATALDLIRRDILAIESTPRYFKRYSNHQANTM